jgi:hypothetical protein
MLFKVDIKTFPVTRADALTIRNVVNEIDVTDLYGDFPPGDIDCKLVTDSWEVFDYPKQLPDIGKLGWSRSTFGVNGQIYIRSNQTGEMTRRVLIHEFAHLRCATSPLSDAATHGSLFRGLCIRAYTALNVEP